MVGTTLLIMAEVTEVRNHVVVVNKIVDVVVGSTTLDHSCQRSAAVVVLLALCRAIIA